MRRPRGTGTIEPTRDGRFRARFRFDRRREEIDGSPFATYDDAAAALDALLAALREGGNVRGGITLKKLGEKCLEQRERDGYRSVDAEWSIWEARVEPWDLAGMPAATITAGDVRDWLARMRREDGQPLATQTRRNALNLLRAVFGYGVEHELVSANPCAVVRVKDHGRTTEGSTYLSLEEAVALVTAATDPAVALAIGTGLRSGELRALQWSDVLEHEIVVRYGSPKRPSKNGKLRRIPILPLAREALDALRGGRNKRAGTVLPSKSGGYRARGQVFDRADWRAWLQTAKLARRVRPHDLQLADNVTYARRALRDSLSRGEAPIASHLLYTQILDDLVPEDRATGIEAGLAWSHVASLRAFYVDRGVSRGMRAAFDHALAHGHAWELRSIDGDPARREDALERARAEIGR